MPVTTKSKRSSTSRSRHTSNETAIRLHIEILDEGGYVATSPDVPGLVAEGRSITETVEIAQGLTRKIVESCLEHGDPLPPVFRNRHRSSQEFRVPVPLA